MHCGWIKILQRNAQQAQYRYELLVCIFQYDLICMKSPPKKDPLISETSIEMNEFDMTARGKGGVRMCTTMYTFVGIRNH